MKRSLLLAVALLIVSMPFAHAQIKVDVEGYKAKITKSDADIENPKKNTKSVTWLDRGKLFQEIASAPTAGAFVGQAEKESKVMFGNPTTPAHTEKIGEISYRVADYSNMTGYFIKDGEEYKLKFWVPTVSIVENPLKKATEAYAKAYELDKTAASKVTEGQVKIGNSYKETANNYLSLQKYAEAAEALADAYQVLVAPPANIFDTLTAFNAGFLYTAGQKYEEGEPYLQKALASGYEAEGDVYFYLYHCYFGLKQIDKAKEILLVGMAKYPNNTRIVEGLLSVYTSGDGDPKEIIPIVEKAITNDPENPSLYSGLGLIHDKLGDADKSIEAFAKAASLLPSDYSANFNLGLLYIKKGDRLNGEFTKKVFSTKEEYNAALTDVNKIYGEAIIPLEKALSLRKDDASAIELLKNLTFRLRDEPGMMDKYNKYNEMFKALPSAEQ